ncbi:hypothetical protein GH733_012761 [Mirounga leonina]|nr:hypothetical protein GH733_012761 [Mirounga leonina]
MAKLGARLRAGSARRAAGPARGPGPLLLVGLALLGAARAQESADGGFSLHPPYFNLAEGARIAASATCGEEAPARGAPRPTEDLYCKLVGGPVAGGDPNQTIQGQYCDICSAASSNRAHPVSNAIDGTERWWQSPPLSRGPEYNEVNVTLDLGQVFHVAYVLIKFANSPRPDLWVLERSTDFGHTYQPWQFFASSKRDCFERFGPQTLERITRDDHVICSTEYSRIVPLENGEIVVSLVNGRPGAMNFSYSPLLRDFTKATNIRLRFLRTNTLLGHLMGKALRDPTVTRRYYYSIKDISIGGRCVCHGHADVCDAQDPADPFRLQCACQHNTCGGSCDRCCPGFNQRPWKPATTDSANECQSCNCHGHAHDCFYDPEVDRHNASQNQDNIYQGGGVCIDCQHHTTGINCERCLPGFYRAPDHPLDSPHACRRCNCESDFTDGTCEDLTGHCYCRPNFTGERCDACAEGFTGFPRCHPVPSFSPNDTSEQVLPAGQIVNCDCSAAGTQGNACRKDPRLGRCVCKPGFQGAHCELCAPGFYGPGCQPCECSSPGVVDGDCDRDSGRCTCREGFEGPACDRCAPVCGCSPAGTLPEGCDEAGHCPCRPGFDGPHCDRCRPGHHGYPDCHACTCDPRGALDQLCGAGGTCHCRPGYAGAACQECSPGFHGFPDCGPCLCSAEGSLHAACDPRSGQCSCRPRVTGLRCDACAPGAYDFPACEGEPRAGRVCPPSGSCHPAGLAPASPSLPEAQAPCTCRAHVEGPSCDRCKPGFWGLSPRNPEGCTRESVGSGGSCSCDPRGTLGGLTECQPGDGQCSCKPHVCGQTCAACRDGFFGLDQADYFGCRSCRCDVGGALGQGCDPRTGACRCRPNTQGLTCSEPARDHYLPDLHDLRLELEEAATPDGHTVRFGFNPLEFESFSWRGYAQMTLIQPRIVAKLNVTSPDLFRLVFRYVNRGPTSVSGRVSVQEEGRFATCSNCTEQSQPVAFPPSTEPAFVTVPQRGLGGPFVLNPGTWALLVEAEGVLLDYVVLLPSTYYEAALLQLRVTEACTFRPAAQRSGETCLLYTHLPLDGFPSAAGPEALCRHDNSLPRPCPTERLSPSHPPLAACLGSDVDVQLQVAVPRPGHYTLVVEYASEETQQEVGVAVHTPQRAPQQGALTLHPCSYRCAGRAEDSRRGSCVGGRGPQGCPAPSPLTALPPSRSTLCRGAALDTQHHLAAFHLDTEASVRLTAEQARFFLHSVTLVPMETFSVEFVEPRVRCVSSHGAFSPSSATCLLSRFPKPPQPIILRDCQVLPLPSGLPLVHSQDLTPGAPPSGPQPRPPTAVDPDVELTLLRHPQGTVVFTTQVPALGRYAFVLHGYQPDHPTFPVEVLISGGRVWQGHANASFCPHAYGCRTLVVCEGQAVLDVTDSELTVTMRVPEGRWLWLEYVLVVPEEVYSSSYLREEPLDKSYDFISQCASHGYHISPASSSPFCRGAASSLSLFYNNGAQPCGCHEAGATGPACERFGGQCPCRAHVIGRVCSRCATGYWGFPRCRPCECRGRLCDELTGRCVCPPRTIPPDCVVCQPQSFGCHPLVGCEECNCSGPGVQELTDPTCDVDSGQCKCRANVTGRRCDACAPGFHGYPNCRPCDCHEAGSMPSMCDPLTGQCHCKENVQGPRCDQCRLGTFSLEDTNPKGCTRCFCFGATERCRGSAHARREHVDMEGWTLLSSDRQVVPHELRAEAELLYADLRHGFEAFPELYWQAPPSYLGDRVSSYGGTLRYELHSEAQRGDVFIPTESRPDVVLQGNQMSITFLEPMYPAPGHVHHGRLQLVEGTFRHTETHNAVSREELMMVLASLERLHIRALFSQTSSAVSLRSVVLEVAGEVGGGPPASNVELCMCPANYRGDSCQECAPGYYRDIKGLFLGRCVPCQCHGHSDRCLPGSGVCMGCQHNTEGDHCEHCRAGFVRSGSEDPMAPCVSCPCPLAVPSNKEAPRCLQLCGGLRPARSPHTVSLQTRLRGRLLRAVSGGRGGGAGGAGGPQAVGCGAAGQEGGRVRERAGARAGRWARGPRDPGRRPRPRARRRCAPGFFGNPLVLGSSCQPCDCSGNGDPNLLFSDCDPLTGACRSCLRHTAGPRCESCAPGFYGNALVPGNCTRRRGAAGGSSCGGPGGRCPGRGRAGRAWGPGGRCPGRAKGERRTRGGGGPRWAGAQEGEGRRGHCHSTPSAGCDCSACGTETCDPHSGHCLCKAGVTGLRCDRCQEGYFGFQDCGGCRPCACGPAAEGSECHPQTGQCPCRPGAAGPQCRECAPGHWGLPERGCRRCQCQGGHCDVHTGHCTCPSGLSGERCDACSQQHEVLVPGGSGGHGVHCEVCDHCVVLLLDDLERAGALLPAIREQLHSVNTSSVAWARLHRLNASVADLQRQLQSPLGLRHETVQQLETLEQQSSSLRQDAQRLDGQAGPWGCLPGRPLPKAPWDAPPLKSPFPWDPSPAVDCTPQRPLSRGPRLSSVAPDPRFRLWPDTMLCPQATRALAKAGRLLDSTEASLGQAQTLLVAIRAVDRILSELESQTDHLFPANASAPSGEHVRRTLAEVERLLGEMRARDLGAPRAAAEAELDAAQRLLARVQEQLSSRWEGNRALAARARDQLAQHEAGLMDLRGALNRAVGTTREAEELNSRNQERLEDALHRKQELSRDNATLRATLQAASDTLAQLSGLLHGMDQAREEYEHLAANLDGARTPLLEKMRAFSPASSKVELVEAAEAHAQQLDQLALNLSSIIRGVNQDRFIQRAIEAANAYGSILQAVQAAEGAAGQALRQATHTWAMVVRGGLASRARDLLTNSSALAEATIRGQQRLGHVWATLQGTGTQLRDAQAKKEQLVARVQEVQAMLAMDTDETSKKIAHAKAVAAEAQDTAARVQSRIQDMQKHLEQWQGQYGGLRSQDLGQVVLDAGRSVSTLEKTLPQLLAKLSLLENRGTHNASLALSASIGRVRELIAQARGAASKVKVSMKFNGRSGVQLRAPRDLSDLAAYTALKFYLQSPEPESGQVPGDRFVLYMGSRQAVGDYMGVALRNQKVHWVYRLGEAGLAALSVDEDIGEQFAAVSIDRTLQFGHMSVTVEKQMLHETKGDTVAPGAEGLLSLRPDDFVFYVGGYPSHFTPPEPLRFPGYLGCIEMDTLNEEVLSVYNFEETFQLDTAVDRPCARSKSTGDPWLTDGSHLDGSGFARISVESQIGMTKRFEQEIRLDQFLCLAAQKGSLLLLYDFGAGLVRAKPQHEDMQKLLTMTTASKAIQVFLLGGNRGRVSRVLVRVERNNVFSVDHSSSLELADAYYLGGVPPDQLPPSLQQLFPSGGSIRGCIKGIKAQGKYVDLKRLNTTGISSGCTADLLVGRAMTFHGDGYLSLELPDVPPVSGHIYSGFGFRSTQDAGLLYHKAFLDGPYQVSLQQGRVTLQLLRTEVKTRGRFADGVPHYVAFYSNDTGVWLYVDDQLQQMKPHQGPPPRPQPQESQNLFLGGLSKAGDYFNFKGCISNVFVMRPVGPQRVFDLQQDWKKVNVSSGCAPTPRTQTPGQAPRGLRAAAARKVGHPEAGVRAGGVVGQKAVPRIPASDLIPSARPTQPPAPSGPCLHTTLASQDHPRCLPVWGPPVQLLGVCSHPGTPRELVRLGRVGRVRRGRPG